MDLQIEKTNVVEPVQLRTYVRTQQRIKYRLLIQTSHFHKVVPKPGRPRSIKIKLDPNETGWEEDYMNSLYETLGRLKTQVTQAACSIDLWQAHASNL